MDLDARLQVRQDAQQCVQGAQVKVIWEALDDALHKVLLSNWILAAHDLIYHPREHALLHKRPGRLRLTTITQHACLTAQISMTQKLLPASAMQQRLRLPCQPNTVSGVCCSHHVPIKNFKSNQNGKHITIHANSD